MTNPELPGTFPAIQLNQNSQHLGRARLPSNNKVTNPDHPETFRAIQPRDIRVTNPELSGTFPTIQLNQNYQHPGRAPLPSDNTMTNPEHLGTFHGIQPNQPPQHPGKETTHTWKRRARASGVQSPALAIAGKWKLENLPASNPSVHEGKTKKGKTLDRGISKMALAGCYIATPATMSLIG